MVIEATRRMVSRAGARTAMPIKEASKAAVRMMVAGTDADSGRRARP